MPKGPRSLMASCCGCWIPEGASSPAGNPPAFGGPRNEVTQDWEGHARTAKVGLDYWGVVCMARLPEVWALCPFSSGLDSWDTLTTGQTFL